MDWKNLNVLVTGGAGFMGSHLVDYLVELGANVIVVDLLSQVGTRNVEKVKNKVTLIDCDVSDIESVKKLPTNVDYIFHLAAYAYPGNCEKNPELAFKSNVQGTFNMLNFARLNGIKKFVFNSSAQLYGRHPKYLPIDEKHPVDLQASVYNLTKKLGENLCDLFHEKYALPVIYFRLFNSFGERQASDYLIPTILIQALKTGTVELWNEKPTRDWLYVRDTVKALVKAAESTYIGGPLNLGSGKETSIGETVSIIVNILKREGVDIKVKFLNKEVTGTMRMACDNIKAKNLLNWNQEIQFEEGLEKTVHWYKENIHLF